MLEVNLGFFDLFAEFDDGLIDFCLVLRRVFEFSRDARNASLGQ